MSAVDQESEEPHDPRATRIVRRMRLLVGLSTGIMVVGFLSVMSVIAWRLVKAEPSSPGSPSRAIERTLALPAGARVAATAADGSRLFVTVDLPGGRQAILVVDAGTLAYRGRIDLVEER